MKYRLMVSAGVFAGMMLVGVSCSSENKPEEMKTSSVKHEPGVPGGTSVETYTLTANVKEIDRDNRTVTLELPEGNKETVECGPEVRNFDQIHVGDQVKVRATEQVAIFMADAKDSNVAAAGASMVTLAPKGAKPGAVAARVRQMTGTVTEIDLKTRHATVAFPDGTVVRVLARPDVDLTQRKVGERIVVRVSESVAISVEKPKED